MPKMSEDQLNEIIRTNFENFGTITSMMTKMNKDFDKPFGFVCYDNHESAKAALESLHN